MIHLRPLPGSPGFGGDFSAVLERAVGDASVLAEAGFPAVMVENLGDSPYFPDRVPPVTVAAMTEAIGEIQRATGLEVGVNVLRNDAVAALSIAAVTGSSFIRVNVLTGVMFTDQGIISGRAHEVVRLKAALAPRVLILADVHVKHAVPPVGLTLEQAASDTWHRGGADALVVSGESTGRPVDVEALRRVRLACPDAPIVIGSGATPATVGELAKLSDSVIVGSALKVDGRPSAPVDPRRAADMAKAAREAGLVT